MAGWEINIGDSWKTVDKIEINIGDVWKTVDTAEINIGDAWKACYSAAVWAWDADNAVDGNTIVMYNHEDNAASTVVTDEGGNYNGVSSTNTSNLNAVGQFNDAFDFDDQYRYDINNDTMDTSISNACRGTLTAECWIKSNVADWSTSGTQCFFYFKVDSENMFTIYYPSGPDSVKFQFLANNTNKNIADTSIKDTTGWHHVAQTIDMGADEYKLWIDGSQVQATQTGLGTWVGTTGTFTVGDFTVGGGKADFIIDKVVFSNTVRYT